MTYLGTVSHIFTHIRQTMSVFLCEVDGAGAGRRGGPPGRGVRWVGEDELEELPIPTGVSKVRALVSGREGSSRGSADARGRPPGTSRGRGPRGAPTAPRSRGSSGGGVVDAKTQAAGPRGKPAPRTPPHGADIRGFAKVIQTKGVSEEDL